MIRSRLFASSARARIGDQAIGRLGREAVSARGREMPARQASSIMVRSVLVAIALSFLGAPVTYRGGAASAHPHPFLQLFLDDQSGSHHANAGAPASGGHQPRVSHDAGARLQHASTIADSANLDDRPRLSIPATFASRTPAVVFTIWSWQVAVPPAASVFGAPATLSARVQAPDPPPPRPASRAHPMPNGVASTTA